MRLIKQLVPVLIALLLAACGSSPQTSFHTLTQPARPISARPANYSVTLQPITIPREQDRPELVVRNAGGGISLLEQDQWAGPLDEAIRNALADELGHDTGAPVYLDSSSPGGRTYRLTVDVRHFDLTPGQSAALAAVWQLRPPVSGVPIACQFELSQPIGGGVPALVGGEQQNVQALAQSIAASLAAVEAGRPLACPPPSPAG